MKKLFVSLLVAGSIFVLAGCGNQTFFDTTYTFDYAYIKLPNGEMIEGNVQSWCDYEGEQLQIKIDGVTYLVNSADAVMIAR